MLVPGRAGSGILSRDVMVCFRGLDEPSGRCEEPGVRRGTRADTAAVLWGQTVASGVS